VGQLVAVVVIFILSAFNFIGVGYGKTIQNIFTVIKIGTIALFVILGFTFGTGASIDFALRRKYPDLPRPLDACRGLHTEK
jgi:APA family basic amino acid/polyamine antiporter